MDYIWLQVNKKLDVLTFHLMLNGKLCDGLDFTASY